MPDNVFEDYVNSIDEPEGPLQPEIEVVVLADRTVGYLNSLIAENWALREELDDAIRAVDDSQPLLAIAFIIVIVLSILLSIVTFLLLRT